MSSSNISLLPTQFNRFAFRFTPEVVQALIPPNALGAYLLLTPNGAVYIGRSDHCLRRRLSKHPHLGQASHFAYEICHTSLRAFCLESYWFHRFQQSGLQSLINSIHPSKPAKSCYKCPFCNPKDSEALQIALKKFAGLPN